MKFEYDCVELPRKIKNAWPTKIFMKFPNWL